MMQDGLMDYCPAYLTSVNFSRADSRFNTFVLPDFLLFFFKSYLEVRTFIVYLNDSSPKPTPSGLPQDTLLSTTLFTL
jgi:hypothetical protein